MKITLTRSGDFETMRQGVNYFRSLTEDLNRQGGDAAQQPDCKPRLKAIPGYLAELRAIAMKKGDALLAEDDKIFGARKTSVMAKGDSLKELEKAKDWFGIFGQETRAHERAVKRGDTLVADDSRKSLELAISYYGLARNEGKVRKVQDKARRLGDAHLKKGEKKIAADYYNLAGLGDKASKLEEAHEAEKEKAEAGRQQKFKQEQKSLEKELGL
jgi:hypothetical protein